MTPSVTVARSYVFTFQRFRSQTAHLRAKPRVSLSGDLNALLEQRITVRSLFRTRRALSLKTSATSELKRITFVILLRRPEILASNTMPKIAAFVLGLGSTQQRIGYGACKRDDGTNDYCPTNLLVNLMSSITLSEYD